jgi:HEAT repeat protein
MNRKLILVVGATLIALVAVIVLWRAQDTENVNNAVSPQDEPASQHQVPTGESSPPTLAPSASGSKGVDAQHKEDVRTGMKALFEDLKQKGILREVPPIAKQLQDALITKDSAVIRRAFQDAIYSPSAQMRDAIPAIKPYLNSPEPYVRYLAAETLLRVGDQSGVDVLLAIVRSNEPVAQRDKDLRIAAATTLAAFNVSAASEGIRDLYSRTKEGELLNSLSSLGVQAREATSWNYVSSIPAIENYAKEGSVRFAPQIATTFEQTTNATTKNAAAWALAKMTGKAQYVNHLIDAARPAIESADRSSYNASTEALRYLGSIQSPQALEVLEKALDSQNPVAVQYATVNLLFNQPGGSQKAEQLVIREFETSPKMLGTDLAMQIASKSDNPQVRAAAQTFATRTGSDRWRYWGVERSNWPIENWVYDYVVTLNR